MADEFEGFANAVDPKGNAFDAREVDAYVDESDEGKVRDASINTKSSITQFKTEGKGTNGAPAAVVGDGSAPNASVTSEPNAEDAKADENDSTPSAENSVAETPTDEAGGKEGDES